MQNAKTLEINDRFSDEPVPLIQAMSGNLRKSMKIKKFVFLPQTSVKNVPKQSTQYYGVRLVRAKTGAYVEYHYRVPRDLPHELWKKEWVNPKTGQLITWSRWRVKEKLNTVLPEEFEDYAAELVRSVARALQSGFDPFKAEIAGYNEITGQNVPVFSVTKDTRPKLSLRGGVDRWLKEYKVGSPSRLSYEVIRTLLESCFGPQFDDDIRSITAEDLESVLKEKEEVKDWKKSTFNDKVKKLRTLFKFLKKKKLVPENIAGEVELKKKVGATRNVAYDDKLAGRVKKLLLEHKMQPYGLAYYRFCMTVYYTCTRPDEETRQIRCKHIDFDRKLLYIPNETAKGDEGGFIPMADELAAMFLEMGVQEAPAEHYVFGREHTPGPIPYAEAQMAWFWREKVRKPNGIASEYTTYSWKHKRVVDLYMAGALPWEIQRLCRHKSATEFETYLRSLGLNLPENINNNAKKF